MPNKIIKITKRGDDGYKLISVRIKEGILAKIDQLSQESNRSRNELINIILESSIDDVEIDWRIHTVSFVCITYKQSCAAS